MIVGDFMKAKINQTEWEIIECAEDGRLILDDSVFYRGTTHYITQKIYLNKCLGEEKLFQVLCHELSHAYLHETQLEANKNSFTDEMLCEFVGLYGKQIVDTASAYMEWRKEIHN